MIGVLHLVGIGWGLPNTDGWDNDGVAPRDFLAGLVETFTPGHYFTYPPVHLLTLTVLTLPVTGVALGRAASLSAPDVLAEILKVPYMTAFALVARIVAVAMSIGIAWAMMKIAEEVRSRRAGLFVAAICGINAPLAYYAHTSNLDVPYLFWGCLALLALVRAIARHEPRRLRAAFVFAVLAIGTKDQAYGLFVLAVPCALASWFVLDGWPRQHARVVVREVFVALATAAGVFVVTDAIVFNPSGFRARLGFLLGGASQDFVHYSRDFLGRSLAFRDTFAVFGEYYPWIVAPFVALGLAAFVRSTKEPSARVAGLVPLFALLSFTLLFNCTALRTEHRFSLPQMVLWSVYAGVGFDAATAIALRPLRVGMQIVAVVAIAWGVARSATVDANLLLDPRYDAEAWLEAHAKPGDVVETYGLNVYLPRFPAQAKVTRVGPEERRNPLPGVTEIVAPFGKAEERGARFVVVCEGWAWRYLPDPSVYGNGYVQPPTQAANAAEEDATGYFRGLLAEKRGFSRVHTATWTSKVWPRLDIHGSLARDVWIFERR